MNQDEATVRQLAAYRRMTPEQRLEIALGLHELACELSREGIRWQHPHASPAEVEQMLKRRLELARQYGDFFIQAISVQSALRPPYQFNAIDNRSALKVDFWVLKRDPFEQVMFSRRQSMTLFGIAAWIATAEDVVLHKLKWNKMTPSERQLQDAAGVWALQQESLDVDYMTDWAQKLGVQYELNQIMRGEIRPKAT